MSIESLGCHEGSQVVMERPLSLTVGRSVSNFAYHLYFYSVDEAV
jgi:hypothetical protein